MKKIITKSQAISILEHIKNSNSEIDIFKKFPDSKFKKLSVEELENKILIQHKLSGEIVAVVDDPVDV